MDKDQLLKEINRDLPELDWKEGAREYLQSYFTKYDRSTVEHMSFAKPLLPITPEDPTGSLIESVSYIANFSNAVRLLALPREARILDVACGGGWLSHWLSRLGYDVYGIDISADFIELARKRIERDPHVYAAGAAEFEVLDIETTPLPASRQGSFDAVILESCLHHFFDPVTALEHIREGLKEGGVALIVEGENRQGPIRTEYLDVMLETRTLERPYSRETLLKALTMAGLGEVSFLGCIDGYISEHDPSRAQLLDLLNATTHGRNTCVAAADPTALRRIIPGYGAIPDTPVTQPPAPTPRYPWIRGPLRRALRHLRDRLS
ncbi:class I SAM-dependent methyltransferase [Arvimicrobium flavum]|uniref:class I SAM-dependent methyltransferase n=1 Tax=Arvimicrobium flavum TaxID=3393320 RepID=UPI00237B8DAC|nr:class I SAM-dependent methyltransferase [Mesorhizobium shangrilense]